MNNNGAVAVVRWSQFENLWSFFDSLMAHNNNTFELDTFVVLMLWKT